MADSAAPPATPKAKKVPKVKKPQKKASHPPYKNMITAAIKTLKERSGSSRQAILKYIVANYKIEDEKKANVRLRLALKKGVSSGDLKQVKGSGASGSFRLNKGDDAGAKKKAPKVKVAAKKATKPKKPAAKKASKPKKPAGKKAAKPKKPAAKKAKKPVAKKAVKKPAPKKTGAKKAAKK